jgi:hypothetical protein
MVAERGEKAATGRLAQLRAAARLRVDRDALARVAADFRS